jgi:hydroxymethylglutaryl-CoA lyase
MSENSVFITECPRDAMQGIHEFIPTETKAKYIKQLLQVGFHRLDFGSFVSPKAIPQLKDTEQVLAKLDLSTTKTDLLAIVANVRGAYDACHFQEIRFLGFPLSISETFQVRNTNKDAHQAFQELIEIQEIATRNGKHLVVYLSMAFGNPYGDDYHPDMVASKAELLKKEGIQHIALADTIGVSEPQNIKPLFETLMDAHPDVEWIAHLHTTPSKAMQNIESAWASGCRHFDSALKGLGGCPMATDALTGNLATETLFAFCAQQKIETGLNMEAWKEAMRISNEVFVS